MSKDSNELFNILHNIKFKQKINNFDNYNIINILTLIQKKNELYNKSKPIYNIKINRLDKTKLNFISITPKIIPSKIDLRNKFQSVYNQGNLGSCTANALCALVGFNNKLFNGSRLFLYYNERILENDVQNDHGATLSDGIQTLLIYGLCSETTWPYIINKFNIKPSLNCYNEGLNHKSISVLNINNDLISMKAALVNNNPFVVGIEVDESFESKYVAYTGLVPMPKKTEKLLGGHAVVCVGFDDIRKLWIMRNSWGKDWGDNGHFYLPYAYLLNNTLTSDLWCIIK